MHLNFRFSGVRLGLTGLHQVGTSRRSVKSAGRWPYGARPRLAPVGCPAAPRVSARQSRVSISSRIASAVPARALQGQVGLGQDEEPALDLLRPDGPRLRRQLARAVGLEDARARGPPRRAEAPRLDRGLVARELPDRPRQRPEQRQARARAGRRRRRASAAPRPRSRAPTASTSAQVSAVRTRATHAPTASRRSARPAPT